MTSVTKPITRKTAATLDRRPIVVTMHPTRLEFRYLRSSKRVYALDMSAAMMMAIRIHVNAQRAEKTVAKKKAMKRKRQ